MEFENPWAAQQERAKFLTERIEADEAELKQIQNDCPHPREARAMTHEGNEWIDIFYKFYCGVCRKRWSAEEE